MKGFFLTIVAIAIIGAIGYGVWSVMNSSGLGQNLNKNQQTVDELNK